jgi:drug/metabolite transporter (DMT)-like permease
VSSVAPLSLVAVGVVLAVIGIVQAIAGRYRAQLPAESRPWTLVGACGALVALALLLAATVDIAVHGTFCSWPRSATTLSGLGVIVSVLPALVAIRETLRHERRSVAYWLMVGAVISAVGLYMWLLTGANHPCPGGFVSDLLN